MIVRSINRPAFRYPLGDFTGGFDSTFHTLGMENQMEVRSSGGLLVGFDLYEDGSDMIYRTLKFSDTTTLEAEWLDGTSAAVVNIALQALVNTYETYRGGTDSTDPELPNSYQRGQTVSRSFTAT